jgi:hypothetical protein
MKLLQKIISKPHLFFFGIIPFSVILGLLLRNETVNFAYYGVAISFNCASIFTISSVFFSMIGLNYFSLLLVKKQPKKGLTVLHIVFQIISLTLFIYYILSMINLETSQEKQLLSFIFFIGFVFFLISILIHLVNFFISLLLKKE